MNNREDMTEEEEKKHTRSLKIKSLLRAIGFFAVYLVIFGVYKYQNYIHAQEYEAAYNAGYDLGYYIAYSGEDVYYSMDTTAFMQFIDDVCSNRQEEAFRDGMFDGKSQGWGDHGIGKPYRYDERYNRVYGK